MAEETQRLILQRTFDAPIEKVWQAWTDADVFARWYGFPGKLEGLTMEAKIDGKWRGTTVTPDGERYDQVAIFRILEENKHLQFDFVDPKDETNPIVEVMDVKLESVEGKTVMTFIQIGNLPPEEYAKGLKVGWTGFFDKLEAVLTEK